MTISNPNNVAILQGNGITTVFPFSFEIPDASNLFVRILDAATNAVLSTLTPGTYSVVGIGNPTGGSVTYPLVGSPLAVDRKLMIERLLPYTQDMDIQNEGGFYPEVIEDQMDRIVMQIQQIAERLTRTPQGNPGQTIPPIGVIGEQLMGANDITTVFNTLSAGVTGREIFDAETPSDVKTILSLGAVDNTSDADKPISTATAAALAGKEPSITAGTADQYWRGDKTFQTLDKVAVGLGNVDNTSDADKPVSTATANALALKQNLSEKGVAGGYASLGGDGKVPSSQLPVSGSYKGSWNASTNTPTITSGVGVNGDFYIVSVAGSTMIDGINTWAVGDQIRFNGTVWQRIPNSSAVSSVNGYVGVVVLAKGDIGLGNVDNTSDADKPISTATAAALAGKQATLGFTPVNKAGDFMTGGLTLQGDFPLYRWGSGNNSWRAIKDSTNGTPGNVIFQFSTDDFVANFSDAIKMFAGGTVELGNNGGVVSFRANAAGFSESLQGHKWHKTILLADLTDLNTVIDGGHYSLYQPLNGPITLAVSWYLEVNRWHADTNRVLQRLTVNEAKRPAVWVRESIGGVWGTWAPEGGWVTPDHYGAVGDASADDSDELELALRSGFPVLLASAYRTTRTVTCGEGFGNGRVLIQGRGARHIFSDHAGNCINFQQTSGFQSYQTTVARLIVRDLIISTSGSSLNSCGISAFGTGGSGSTTRTLDIQNLTTEGINDNTGFDFGIAMLNSRNNRIVGCSHQGVRNKAAGSRTGAAVILGGDSDPVDTTITGSYAYFCGIGFQFYGTCEGMSVLDCTAVACDKGVDAQWDENPISGDNAGKPLLTVDGCHFNTYAYGIYMARVRDYCLVNNDMLVETANSNWNGIRNDQESSASEYGWIDGNKFQDAHGLSSGTTIGINLDGHTTGVLESRIGVNRYVSLDIGLNLGSNAKNVRYSSGSVYAAVTTPVNNLGGGTNTSY